MARGSRLAAGAREEHEVLPALGGSRKHGERRWDPEHNRTRSGEGGSIHLRSKRRGTHSGRAAVLRTFPPSRAGTARSEQGGITQRRADLYDASVREGPGGHRACFAGLVCEQLGGGYGLYGKLVDVWPNGFAQNLTEGILRLRYRNSQEKPELANPGQVYRISVNVWATSNVFLVGHKLRLEISSSNFPRFDRNTNTGENQAQA